jgi:hypothetical protein
MIRKTVTAGLSLSVAATGLLLAGPAGATAPVASAAARLTPTHYAMQASGYSTRVQGGGVPVSSDRTAFQVIACTNKAGLSKSNRQAGLNVAGIHVGVANTHVWTTERNNTVSSYAQNRIARVAIRGTAVPTDDVVLYGVSSLSRTWHNGRGYHASTRANIARITVAGLDVPVPAPGQSVDLGGILKLTLNNGMRKHDRNGAKATLDAVTLNLNLTTPGTTANLAHSRSTISGGIKSGLFRGSAYAARAQALAGTARVGRTPLIVMPCQGTNGNVRRQDIVRVNPAGLIIKGLHADESASQTRTSAMGYERGRVARVALGGGNRTLVVRGVVGKANMHYRQGRGLRFDTKGSQVVSVGVRRNGTLRPLHFGRDNTINIAGLATLRSHIVKRTKSSIQITELRISVLGTGPNAGAEIDLGYAKIGFMKSGL